MLPRQCRLALGIPFYGYNFSETPVSAVTYAAIVSANVTNADRDVVGETYYNGIITVKKKVNWAVQTVGGIMTWEVGQDSFDNNSLLLAVHDECFKFK